MSEGVYLGSQKDFLPERRTYGYTRKSPQPPFQGGAAGFARDWIRDRNDAVGEFGIAIRSGLENPDYRLVGELYIY